MVPSNVSSSTYTYHTFLQYVRTGPQARNASGGFLIPYQETPHERKCIEASVSNTACSECGDEWHSTKCYAVDMRIRQLNHSAYQVEYHIVFGTKYRRKILKDYVKVELLKSIKKVQRRFPDWYIPQFNTGEDHVHFLIEIPPKYSVSYAVQTIKSATSSHLRKAFKYINRIYQDGNVWSVGYFVSTVGLNESNIKKYIERQSKFDRGFDISGEFS